MPLVRDCGPRYRTRIHFGGAMISQTPVDERPRERCVRFGPDSLSLSECLAVLIGSGPRGIGASGVARNILARAGEGDEDLRLRYFFHMMEDCQLRGLDGVLGAGPATRARIAVAFDIARRYHAIKLADQVRGNREYQLQRVERAALAKISREHRGRPDEWIGFVPVFDNERTGSLYVVSRGGRAQVEVSCQELFARILALRPLGIVLFHNHPSGHAVPSTADEILTRKISSLSKDLGISFLGHWVVTATGERKVGMNHRKRAG